MVIRLFLLGDRKGSTIDVIIDPGGSESIKHLLKRELPADFPFKAIVRDAAFEADFDIVPTAQLSHNNVDRRTVKSKVTLSPGCISGGIDCFYGNFRTSNDGLFAGRKHGGFGHAVMYPYTSLHQRGR